ncbi:Abi-alpha family protein [Azospirillum thiophilum]
MLHDHLKVVRFERQVRLLDRAAEFMAERGKAGPDRKIPLNVALPLLEAATLEEDNDLQDLWVRLLVNGTDGDRPDEIERSFVSILRDMSRLDAEILQKIGDADNGTGVWTAELPELAISYRRGSERPAEKQEPSDDVNISLSNLTRLGVIDPTAGFGGPMSRGLVRLTPLGRALLRAVSA